MTVCNFCGIEIVYANRWLKNLNPHHGNRDRLMADKIPCEIHFEPGRHYPESFIEAEENQFVSIFRHYCPQEETILPERKKRMTKVFVGDRQKFPNRKPKKYKNESELEF